MFAGANFRSNHNEQQQSNFNLKSDSEHKIAYKVCKSAIYTLCTIESKIVHHGPIWVLCAQKTNQI